MASPMYFFNSSKSIWMAKASFPSDLEKLPPLHQGLAQRGDADLRHLSNVWAKCFSLATSAGVSSGWAEPQCPRRKATSSSKLSCFPNDLCWWRKSAQSRTPWVTLAFGEHLFTHPQLAYDCQTETHVYSQSNSLTPALPNPLPRLPGPFLMGEAGQSCAHP